MFPVLLMRKDAHFRMFAVAIRRTSVPLRDLRHCVHRRQERHSISIATPSSISTMTPSPMIASLVRRSMIKFGALRCLSP
jgi:hypothetical protein